MSAQFSQPQELIDFIVSNGVKGLSQLPLNSIPSQFIQPPQERLNPTQILQHESIPIIDLTNINDPMTQNSIFDAASKWGFFQIVNHGIPIEVLEDVIEAGHRFFELPNEERKKFLKENSKTQSVELKTSFNPLIVKVLEWKDYLLHRYVQGDEEGSKYWPDVSRNKVLEYMKWALPLMKKLLQILLQGLNVKDVDENKQSMLLGSILVTLLYYPLCPNPDLASGAGRHSDISTLTLLLQDDVGGLYVQGTRPDTLLQDDVGGLYVQGTRPDTWIHVKPVKGALVVNIGDVLQIVSNDRYKSMEHRVVVNGSRNRVSVAVFGNPRGDGIIGPFNQVLENGEEPIYKSTVFSEYFNYFFSKGHDGKQTIEYAKV